MLHSDNPECSSSKFLYTAMLRRDTDSIWEQGNQTGVWLRVEGGGCPQVLERTKSQCGEMWLGKQMPFL